MKQIKKMFSIFLWIAGSVLLLLLLIIFLIRLPSVQQFITQKAVDYLEGEIQTEVRLDRLYIGFPKSIIIGGFYMEDRNRDTLVDLRSLEVDMDMWALWNRRIELNSVKIHDLNSNISKRSGEGYNFQYILDAFASDAPPPAEHSPDRGWEFGLGTVLLSDVRFDYEDAVDGLELKLDLGTLHAGFDAFDPGNRRYRADHIRLTATYIGLTQTKAVSAGDSVGNFPGLDLALGELLFDRVRGQYVSLPAGREVSFDLEHFAAYPETIDPEGQIVAIREMELNNSDLVYLQHATDSVGRSRVGSPALEDVASGEAVPSWSFRLGSFDASGNSIRYEDYNHPVQKQGLDPFHMHWVDLGFSLRDVQVEYPGIRGDINALRGREQSGFALDKLAAEVEMDSRELSLINVRLKTPQTDLSLDVLTEYPSIEHLTDSVEMVRVNLDLPESTLGFRDITLFRPELAKEKPFAGNPNGNIRLRSSISGTMGALDLKQFELKYGADTRMSVKGKIAGLPDLENTYFDLEISRLISTRSRIKSLLPEGALPGGIELPERFSATASFKGKMDDFDASWDVHTNTGRIMGTAHMATSKENISTYRANVSLEQFDLGALLGDTMIGTTKLRFELKGTQLDPAEMTAELEADVAEWSYRGYTYRNLTIRSTFARQRLNLSAQLRDSNVVFDLEAMVDVADEVPGYEGQLTVEGADLQALGFTDTDLRAKGVLFLDGQGIKADSLRGTLSLNRGLIIKEGKRYDIDSLYADVNTMDSISRLDLYSDFIRGHVEGNVDPGRFPSVFRTHIEHYLDTASADSALAGAYGQQFDFEFTVDESTVLTEVFLPDLEQLAPGTISGHYRSKARDMEMNVYFPKIIYDGTTFDSLVFLVHSAKESVDFVLQSRSVTNPSIRIDHPELSGQVHDRRLDIGLSIAGDSTYRDLLLRGALTMEDSTYRFRFDEDGLVLADESWEVAKRHYIAFGKKGIRSEDLILTHGDRSVAFEQEGEHRLRIAFERFSLQDISQAFQKDKMPLSGEMNGNLFVEYRDDTYLFEGDMTIGDFHFMEYPVGTLALELQNEQAGVFDLDAQLSGSGNEASLRGRLDTRAEMVKMDMTADVSRLEMKTIEAFTAGQLQHSSGYLSGDARITGSTDRPHINGRLRFNDARMQVSRLNTSFRLSDELIVFDNDNIRFDRFTVLDSLGNKAVFNGRIAMKNFDDPGFMVDVRIDNFHLFDKEEEKGALFYGHLILDSEIQIRGDLDRPEIKATAQVVKGSDIVLVIPSEDPRLESAGGIDAYIDRDLEHHPLMKVEEVQDTVKSNIRGIDLRANVKVDRSSEVKILLDESGGNYLQARGDADLIVGIDPGGNVSLTGRYEIYEGKYQLLFRNVVKRTFILKEGSSLVWTGDPMKARVDLTAVHTKKAEPLGLVQDQLIRGDETNANRFRQALPFEIELHMNEELLSPYIDFDISLPRDYQGAVGGQVQAKLNQLNQNESEVNKQVFSLLVLGRFVPQDPFSSTSTAGAELAARRSVSRLLNAQLDKLSDKYINTVELDLNLESYEDYSSGKATGRTELNIGLQRAFFDERLRVRVGGTLDLEGERRRTQQAGDLIGDVSIEYALTEDGTWRLRAFRKNEYAGIIDGDIIKTGTSLIFRRDYDRISELFKKTKSGEK